MLSGYNLKVDATVNIPAVTNLETDHALRVDGTGKRRNCDRGCGREC